MTIISISCVIMGDKEMKTKKGKKNKLLLKVSLSTHTYTQIYSHSKVHQCAAPTCFMVSQLNCVIQKHLNNHIYSNPQ